MKNKDYDDDCGCVCNHAGVCGGCGICWLEMVFEKNAERWRYWHPR